MLPDNTLTFYIITYFLGYSLLILTSAWAILIGLSVATWRMVWGPFAPTHDLSPTLLLPHSDWPSFLWLNRIPRYLSAFVCSRPPIKLFGTCPRDHHFDVPADNTWVVTWPFSIAYTRVLPDGSKRLFRFYSLRYDYEDPKHYYNLGAAWHRM